MKFFMTLGALLFSFAATQKTYQYKDISSKTARPFPAESKEKEYKGALEKERRPAEYKAKDQRQRTDVNAKEIR